LIPELGTSGYLFLEGWGIRIKQPWVNFKTLHGPIDFHDGIWKELGNLTCDFFNLKFQYFETCNYKKKLNDL
jgi:hypothetical protein